MRKFLNDGGFLEDDPRWKGAFIKLNETDEINESSFRKIFCNFITDIKKILNNNFALEDFQSFITILKEIYDDQMSKNGGELSKNIPWLSQQNPDKYGMSFCSIDGQRYNIGDYEDLFCVQGCSKPIIYGIATENIGLENITKYVSHEPSGNSSDTITLTTEHKPHNPFVNMGAILTCTFIEQELNQAERFEKLQNWWKRLAGGYKPGFDLSMYLSEYETAYKNFHLAYYMKADNLLPPDVDIIEALKFYTQCNAIEMSCKKLAVVSATLANGGVCPITHEKVFSSSTTKNILSLMYSCGMNDYSGQFAFRVGLPAKSSESGCVMIVVPNVGGFCIWSPKLDQNRCSVKGGAFCKELVKRFVFHNFDIFSKDKNEKTEINLSKEDSKECNNEKYYQINPIRRDDDEEVSSLLFAAYENDISTIHSLLMRKLDLNISDYDGRTALHIACSEGHTEVVKFLMKHGANPTIKDRMNNTPLDDAIRCSHTQIIDFLKKI